MSPPVFEMAKQLAPHGALRKYLRQADGPSRAIGLAVIRDFLMQRPPSPQQLVHLRETFRLASAIAQQAAADAAQRRRAKAAAKAARRPSAKRPKVPIPVRVLLFTRDRKHRWRGQRVPLLAAFLARPEGTA
jgi:hypothetical protein